MNIKRYINVSLIAMLVVLFTSCVDDLNTLPLDRDVTTADKVLKGEEAYKQLLAKCYGALIMGGQTGIDGNPDISSINGGFSSYLRQFWNLQELTTDEAICAWGDGDLPNLHQMNWTSSNTFVTALYYRINLEIAYCNNLISNTTEDKYKEINTEARMLRALAYWHMLDMFGTGPMVTEKDKVGSFFFPKQADSKELFTYIERELKAIESELKAPQTNEYGRVDQGAAWMVLAKLYLNAKEYIGEERYSDCITYCKKITSAGYTLENKYANLFLADNNLRRNEIIFPIAADGSNSQTWGGMTFLINASVGGDMTASLSGIDGGWWGNRTTKQFVSNFSDETGVTDSRAIFFTGHQIEIDQVSNFKHGYGVMKFKNLTSTGVRGANGTHPDTDFPMFRYSDALLMYAEAVLRGGTGGSRSVALGYINDIRERAYGNTSGNIADADLDLNFILSERARELYWEGHRRTDLRRFGKLTSSSYLWAWKGNVKEGVAVDNKYNIFPIPASDLNANSNLKPTAGY